MARTNVRTDSPRRGGLKRPRTLKQRRGDFEITRTKIDGEVICLPKDTQTRCFKSLGKNNPEVKRALWEHYKKDHDGQPPQDCRDMYGYYMRENKWEYKIKKSPKKAPRKTTRAAVAPAPSRTRAPSLKSVALKGVVKKDLLAMITEDNYRPLLRRMQYNNRRRYGDIRSVGEFRKAFAKEPAKEI